MMTNEKLARLTVDELTRRYRKKKCRRPSALWKRWVYWDILRFMSDNPGAVDVLRKEVLKDVEG